MAWVCKLASEHLAVCLQLLPSVPMYAQCVIHLTPAGRQLVQALAAVPKGGPFDPRICSSIPARVPGLLPVCQPCGSLPYTGACPVCRVQ